jgi:hypothetical protein
MVTPADAGLVVEATRTARKTGATAQFNLTATEFATATTPNFKHAETVLKKSPEAFRAVGQNDGRAADGRHLYRLFCICHAFFMHTQVFEHSFSLE